MSGTVSQIADAEIDDLIAELQAGQQPHLSRIDPDTGRKVASAEWTCEDCGAIHHARYFSQDRMLLPPFPKCQKCGEKIELTKRVFV